MALANLLREIEQEFDRDDLLTTLPFSDVDMEGFDLLLDFDWTENRNSPDDKDTPKKMTVVKILNPI